MKRWLSPFAKEASKIEEVVELLLLDRVAGKRKMKQLAIQSGHPLAMRGNSFEQDLEEELQ